MKPKIRRAYETGSALVAIELAVTLLCCSRPFGKTAYAVLTAAAILVIYFLAARFTLSFARENGAEWRPVSVVVAIIVSSLCCIVMLFANLYRCVGIEGGPITTDLGICAYFSVITITTVGYGDFHPFNGHGRIITAAEALSGYLILGAIVASVANMLRPRRDAAE